MNTIAFHTLYALCYLLSLLPLRVLYVMSDITYLIVAHLLHYRRKVIRKNIASSFPEKSKEEQQQIERDFYRYFCDYFFETIKLASMSAGQLKRRMTFTGMEEINRVLNSGQSCAIYLGHYGNWEWLTSLPLWVPEQVQCGQIYHPLENEATNRLFLKLRQHFHSRSIAIEHGMSYLSDDALDSREHGGVVMEEVHPVVDIHPVRALVGDISYCDDRSLLLEAYDFAKGIVHGDAP